MFRRQQARFEMSVEQCMTAVVVRHPETKVREVGHGKVELSLPYRRPWILRLFSPGRKTFLRRFELDETGSDLWRQIDDRRTVADLVTYVTNTGGQRKDQATESVVAYVQILLVRGLVGLVVPSAS